MDMTREKPVSNWRKVVISGLVGAAIGIAGMLGLFRLHDAGGLGEISPSGMIACVAGAVYILLGLQVSLGLALPALGAKMLNVEDAEDLQEQRRMLAFAAGAMVAWGAALVVLALGRPGGVMPATTALAAVLSLFALSVLLTILMWRRMDELMKVMSRECGNLSFYLALVAGGGWAMLAHLGFTGAPAPLDWLTMFTALPLLASFLAVGRRGLLLPR